ncbi:MAG: SAM-dependent methyltransferase [Limisphaerales bacterium]|jgi:SAM-dependent methyltransferase
MKLDPIRFIIKQIRRQKYKSGLKDFSIVKDPMDEIGAKIGKETFIGGGKGSFGSIGRLQLITFLKVGLTPDSKFLDIGCGGLRAGYWFIHFLKPGNYCGIEPNEQMLGVGKKHLFSDGSLELKKPRFNHNQEFDFSVFNEQFDFFVARSIWTHCGKAQIEIMLDSFKANKKPGGVFLASYLKPYYSSQDYKGTDWVGISLNSKERGVVFHKFSWIQEACKKRGLVARELPFDVARNQIWIEIR